MKNRNYLRILTGLLISISIFAVEERNPVPFYYLNTKKIQIKINPKKYSLCKVKIKEVILQKNTEIQDCFKIEKKLSDLIKTIQEKNSKKNELNLMFVDENKNIINPELNVNSDSYTIKSIIYFKKTKIHQIELIDKERNYFYFNFDPNHVTIGE